MSNRIITRQTFLLGLLLVGGAALLLAAAGCGEKIAIPEAKGLYSGSPYQVAAKYDDASVPRQIAMANNYLLVISDLGLMKRDQNYGAVDSVQSLTSATALCVNEDESLVFVFEATDRRVSWYETSDLTLLGEVLLPEVQECFAMVTCSVGVEQYPGAETFLYLADEPSGVIHRYAYDAVSGLNAYGILARADGNAARFVHKPTGMARDFHDSLLVAESDTLRNWVIRFHAEPDTLDATADPDDQDELRGRAALWDNATGCQPHPAGDFVLGNAPDECGQTDWDHTITDEPGFFDGPMGMAVDGSGRIFVADRGNDRIQIFDDAGDYALLFGNPDRTPRPVSVGVIDKITDPANNLVNFGAYVYIVLEDQPYLMKYVSNEQANEDNLGPPPDDF